jgi:hypothetical protein
MSLRVVLVVVLDARARRLRLDAAVAVVLVGATAKEPFQPLI